MVYVKLLKCSGLPRLFAVAVFPATFVPVTTQVGGVARYAHQMAGSLRNRSVTTGAHVVLVRFVRLHSAHFHRAIETIPHRWRRCARALALAFLGTTFGHARNAHATSAPMMMKALAITT